MKRIVLSFLISLLPLTHCFSQTISNDTTYTITAEQLKLTNMIFAEHEFLSKKVPLLEQEINDLKELNTECETNSLVYQSVINDQEARIKKLNKSIKVKNTLITGTGVGFVVSLILLICGK